MATVRKHRNQGRRPKSWVVPFKTTPPATSVPSVATTDLGDNTMMPIDADAIANADANRNQDLVSATVAEHGPVMSDALRGRGVTAAVLRVILNELLPSARAKVRKEELVQQVEAAIAAHAGPDFDTAARIEEINAAPRSKRLASRGDGTTARSVRARSDRDAEHAANVLMQPPLVPTYNTATSPVILPTGVRNGALSTSNPGDVASEANASLSSGWIQDVPLSTSSTSLVPTLPIAVSSTSSSTNLPQSSSGSVVLSLEAGSRLGGLAPTVPAKQGSSLLPLSTSVTGVGNSTSIRGTPSNHLRMGGCERAAAAETRCDELETKYEKLEAKYEELEARLRIAADTGDKALRQVAELASQVHTLATAQRQQHRQPRRTSSSETDSTLAINKR